MDVNKWETEFKKGFSKPFVLLSLFKEPNYPYGIIKAIKEKTNKKFEIAGPNIYPILTKMEKMGLIAGEQDEETKKKTYTLTNEGKVFLASLKESMKEFIEVIETMMK